MFYGARVVRGLDWAWGDQDGGEGHVGTIIAPEKQHINEINTVWIHWDNGVSANYNARKGEGHDLRIYDNAQLGVKHVDVRCDGCMKWHMEGFRFKCVTCPDFDLCTNCYMSDNHDTSHLFQRIDVPRAEPAKLPARDGSKKVKAKGIFAGATVKRGLKWKWGDQDGGKGSTGKVTHLDNWNKNTYRSMVKVEWSNGRRNQYRLGYNGQVDIIFVKGKEGHAGFYYPSHLPDLDFERTPSFITSGDKVRVKDLKRDVFEKLQRERCGWRDDMMKALDKVGEVQSVDKDGDIKVKFGSAGWFFNPMCLLPEEKGDQGRVGREAMVDTRGDSEVSDASTLLQVLKLLHTTRSPRAIQPGELVAAAAKGDLAKVKELTEKHPNWVDHSNEHGHTALHVASHEGYYQVVETLFAANANLEKEDNVGDTALSFSIFGNKPSITRLLIKRGSQVNAVNNNGRSSLHIAATKGNSACLAALLNHPDVQVNLQDGDGQTAVMRAIESNDQATIDLLADEPSVDFKLKNKKGFNALHYAAFKGSAHAAERIVMKCGSDVIEDKKLDGFTALHLAAINNHVEVGKVLIREGRADLNCRNHKLETPVHLACNEGLNSSIELLVNNGAKVNLQDEDGDTPLHTMLMKQTVRDIIGNTPAGMLMKSMTSGDTSAGNTAAIAIYLIKNGADIYIQNHKGKTVLDCVANPVVQTMIKNAHSQVRARPGTASLRLTTGKGEDDCIIS